MWKYCSFVFVCFKANKAFMKENTREKFYSLEPPQNKVIMMSRRLVFLQNHFIKSFALLKQKNLETYVMKLIVKFLSIGLIATRSRQQLTSPRHQIDPFSTDKNFVIITLIIYFSDIQEFSNFYLFHFT